MELMNTVAQQRSQVYFLMQTIQNIQQNVNLPAADVHGSQPALEALRRLLDVAVLYDRQRLPAIGTFDDGYEGLGPSRESPLARLAHFVVIKSLFTHHFFLLAVSFFCRYFARAPKPQANPSSGWTQCA